MNRPRLLAAGGNRGRLQPAVHRMTASDSGWVGKVRPNTAILYPGYLAQLGDQDRTLV